LAYPSEFDVKASYVPFGRPTKRKIPKALLEAEPARVPVVRLYTLTVTFDSGAPLPSAITVPLIASRGDKAKFLPDDVLPAATAIGVPDKMTDVGHELSGQGMLSKTSCL
jgi:hypothetical protein